MQYDIANAPTELLIQREHHRVATLGRNQIIRDHYKTQALSGRERMTKLLPRPTWRRVAADLIREKTKGLRRLIGTVLKVR